MSVEQDNAPDVIAMIGASCALSISDIPFNGPIAGVRVGYIDKQFILNPTVAQQNESELNLIVAGSHDAVMMLSLIHIYFNKSNQNDKNKKNHNNQVKPNTIEMRCV